MTVSQWSIKKDDFPSLSHTLVQERWSQEWNSVAGDDNMHNETHMQLTRELIFSAAHRDTAYAYWIFQGTFIINFNLKKSKGEQGIPMNKEKVEKDKNVIL